MTRGPGDKCCSGMQRSRTFVTKHLCQTHSWTGNSMTNFRRRVGYTRNLSTYSGFLYHESNLNKQHSQMLFCFDVHKDLKLALQKAESFININVLWYISFFHEPEFRVTSYCCYQPGSLLYTYGNRDACIGYRSDTMLIYSYTLIKTLQQ